VATDDDDAGAEIERAAVILANAASWVAAERVFRRRGHLGALARPRLWAGGLGDHNRPADSKIPRAMAREGTYSQALTPSRILRKS
jgi:hypothetical protein